MNTYAHTHIHKQTNKHTHTHKHLVHQLENGQYQLLGNKCVWDDAVGLQKFEQLRHVHFMR
jgi:hypothetical protein